MTPLKVIEGTCAKSTVRPSFCFSWMDRRGKPLPTGWRLVATGRTRVPYVLDLRLWTNPKPPVQP
jgi:hypothetical protein